MDKVNSLENKISNWTVLSLDLITLDGELHSPGMGSISGGTYGAI